MYSTSEAFQSAVRTSHRVKVKCEIFKYGEYVQDLNPIDGSVSVDATSAIRRSCRLQFEDSTGELTPDTARDLLNPFGTTIRLYRGVVFADGSEELVPLGVFVPTDVEIKLDEGVTTLSVVGNDLSWRITQNRWLEPYQIVAGTAVETAISVLLGTRLGSVKVELEPTGYVTGNIVLEAGSASDPWRDALEIAKAAGLDLFFDVDGVVRGRRLNIIDIDPTIVVYSDTEVAVVLDANRRLTIEGVYNGVIVEGESSANTVPVRAEAWDDNPNSPTYRYGPFGQVPMWLSSSLVTTAEQAYAMALTELQKVLGTSEDLSWNMIVNPAHDVFDVVRIVRPELKVDDVFVIEALEIPLRPEQSMSARARERRIFYAT